MYIKSEEELQIEEMAHIFCTNRFNTCDNCLSKSICHSYRNARALYNAGYRKQTDVASGIFEEIESLAKIYTFPVVKMGVIEIVKEPFWCIEPRDFDKLKKKYTEE